MKSYSLRVNRQIRTTIFICEFSPYLRLRFCPKSKILSADHMQGISKMAKPADFDEAVRIIHSITKGNKTEVI